MGIRVRDRTRADAKELAESDYNKRDYMLDFSDVGETSAKSSLRISAAMSTWIVVD